MRAEDPEVRPLTPEDIVGFLRVANQAFLEDARRPTVALRLLASSLRRSPGMQFVAVKDGKVVGFILGGIEGKIAWINLLAVHPAYWRRGVGTALIRRFEKAASEQGVEEVRLGTPFARGFYEKLGYECYEVRWRLIREIVQRSIPPVEGYTLEPLTFSDLEEVVGLLDRESLLEFLEKYAEVLEPFKGLAFKGRSAKGLVGLIIVQHNRWTRELLEVRYLYGINLDAKEGLLDALTFEASRMGYRWIGIETRDEALVKRLLAKGWEEAHMPEFWSMYMMRKRLKRT